MNPQRGSGGACGRGRGVGGRGSRGRLPGQDVQNGGGDGEPPVQAGGVRRRRVEMENGDRYCPACGQVIFGQAREQITRCPYRNCGVVLPYAEGREFQNAWGRCTGHNCMNYLENTMNYCTLCGLVNPVAFERRDRLERARRQQEEFRLRARIRELEAAEARRNEEFAELQRVIQAQENELFARELPFNVEEMLLDDGEMQDAPGNAAGGNENAVAGNENAAAGNENAAAGNQNAAARNEHQQN